MKMLFVAVIVWDNMAELGPNYNIQCMKLFQELKASFPSIPDSVVRHCMKQVSSRHFDFNYVILIFYGIFLFFWNINNTRPGPI